MTEAALDHQQKAASAWARRSPDRPLVGAPGARFPLISFRRLSRPTAVGKSGRALVLGRLHYSADEVLTLAAIERAGAHLDFARVNICVNSGILDNILANLTEDPEGHSACSCNSRPVNANSNDRNAFADEQKVFEELANE